MNRSGLNSRIPSATHKRKENIGPKGAPTYNLKPSHTARSFSTREPFKQVTDFENQSRSRQMINSQRQEKSRPKFNLSSSQTLPKPNSVSKNIKVELDYD